MGRWLRAGGIWLLSVIITGKSLHLVNVLAEPERVTDAQYGIVIFVFMGAGWFIGWIPALMALRLARRKPGFDRVALVATFLYDLLVFALLVTAEYVVLHQKFEWSTPVSYLLALFPSILGTMLALMSPLAIVFGLLALLPLLGLLWLLFARSAPGKV